MSERLTRVKMSKTSVLKSFLFGLCACINVGISVTLMIAMNALFTDWLTYFQADKGTVSAVEATCVGLFFGGGLIAGVLERKLGERRCLMLGSFLSTVGLLAGSYAPSLPVLIFCVGVVEGSGFCIIHLSSISIALRRFQKRTGFMSSALAATAGLFSLSTPVLYRFFSDEYMWRGSLMFASAVALHTFVLGLLLTSPILQSTQEQKTTPPRNDTLCATGDDHIEMTNTVPLQQRQCDLDRSGPEQDAHTEQGRIGNTSSDSGGLEISQDQGQAHEVLLRNIPKSDSEPGDLQAASKETNTEDHFCRGDSESGCKPDDSITVRSAFLLPSQSPENYRCVSPTPLTASGQQRQHDSATNVKQGSIRNVLQTFQANLHFMKNPLYVCVVLCSVINFCTLFSIRLLVLDYTSSRGWSVQDGVLINFLFALSSLLGRMLAGLVSLHPRVHNTSLLIFSGLLGSFAVCLIGQVYSFTLAAVFYVCLGMGYGVTMGMYPAAVMDTVGKRHFSIGFGMSSTVMGIFVVVIGILTGVLVDLLQSYSLLSLVYGVVNLASTISLLVAFIWCRR
ncbi:uncharacterized protein LOC143290919 isoform X1 [Babylonia areolata]|uniref:uncharacterized protein LOC143290919 isoform X1 n=2 Tax=Babylonia areolata TaxID=304850 RepID=UPI003FD44DAF